MRARHGATGRVERKLDTAAGGFPNRTELHAELDGPRQRLRQPIDDAIVAIEHVVPLVAEDAERRELRAPVGVDEEQKVEAALLIGLETVLGDVGRD